MFSKQEIPSMCSMDKHVLMDKQWGQGLFESGIIGGSLERVCLSPGRTWVDPVWWLRLGIPEGALGRALQSASIQRAVPWTDLEPGCSTQGCKCFLRMWLNPLYTFFSRSLTSEKGWCLLPQMVYPQHLTWCWAHSSQRLFVEKPEKVFRIGRMGDTLQVTRAYV